MNSKPRSNISQVNLLFLPRRFFVYQKVNVGVPNSNLARKIKDKIDKDERKLLKCIEELERIWEKTNLDPKESAYLIEKTMRFELAREPLTTTLTLFKEIIGDYKKLCDELESNQQ